MKAVVHLGMPKSGSSTIQDFLAANAAALGQRGLRCDVGAAAVDLGMMTRALAVCHAEAMDRLINNAPIVRSHGLQTRAAQTAFADRFNAALSAARDRHPDDTFVLSSEYVGAATLIPQAPQAFDQWLRRHFDDITYILHVRRQEDWFASSYSQRLRAGDMRPLTTFLDKRKRADWNAIASRWAAVAGPGRLRVRLLERDALRDGDLVTDFCHEIGTSPDGLNRISNKNKGLSGAAAEILRALNERIPHTIDGGKRLNPEKQSLRDILLSQDLGLPPIALSPAQVDDIRAHFAASNAQLCATYFPDRDSLFAPRPATSVTQTQPEHVAIAAADLMARARRHDGVPAIANRLRQRATRRFGRAFDALRGLPS